MAQRVREFFCAPFVKIFPFTETAADQYARIRGELRVSSADAIHLACAAEAEVDIFLTNDRFLANRVVPGIQFIAGLDSNLVLDSTAAQMLEYVKTPPFRFNDSTHRRG